jgi:hypothetical protein
MSGSDYPIPDQPYPWGFGEKPDWWDEPARIEGEMCLVNLDLVLEKLAEGRVILRSAASAVEWGQIDTLLRTAIVTTAALKEKLRKELTR